MASQSKYLHGYTSREQQRLYEQARMVENIIFNTIDYSETDQLLEIGCGVGAMSEILLRRFPHLTLTGIDYQTEQVDQASSFLKNVPYATDRYTIRQMDAMDMDFESSTFDAAFICWVLEHVSDPLRVLTEARRVLKPGSQVVITEVLNSTFFVEPYSPNVLQYWMRFNDFQYDHGGDPFVGAKLGNLLQAAGYNRIETTIKTFHLDNRNPAKRASMIRFWTDLLMSGLPQLTEAGYVSEEIAEQVNTEMRTVAKSPSAVFYYSFVQAKAYTT
ncbi:class I SAM-dependent methyltransferase [Roseivirga sp. BDSF3-8]|uniref:class I SAM-dependent methyltransferase n=1 Tax=Roseivirga sp. BDSF3-8 TaxID=3241598 RepID=UPI0035320509